MSDDFLDSMVPGEWSDWRRWLYRHPRPDMTHLIISADGRVAGYCDVGRSRSKDRPDITGELFAIYVDPDRIGTGLGRRLIEAGRRAIAALGHRRAELWVLDTNDRARRFYVADGWQTDGTAKTEELGGATITEVRYVRDIQ